MSRFFLLPLLAAGLTVMASAQSYNGHGYAHMGLEGGGGSDLGSSISFGAGGEGFAWRGLAVGGELNYLAPPARLNYGIGLVSVNPAWHFVNREKPARLVPFVTGGYSLAFRSGVAHLYNLGGGLTWWFRPRIGLRTEVRVYSPITVETTDHLASVRIGLSFR